MATKVRTVRSFDDERFDETAPTAGVDKAALMKAAVLRCDDRTFWRIPPEDSQGWHPGVCIEIELGRGEVAMLKGTSQDKRSKYRLAFVRIEPDEQNGLLRPTYFDTGRPNIKRLRKVELLHHDRRLGTLADNDLARLKTTGLYRNPFEAVSTRHSGGDGSQ